MTRLREIWEQLATEERVVLMRVAASRLQWPTRWIELEDVEAVTRREHIEFIHLVASRLLAGQSMYGKLNIANDLRDWEREAMEEDADGAVYRAIGALAKEMAISAS